MALKIEMPIIDCVDLDRMSKFWQAALDLYLVRFGPSGGHLLEANDGSGQRLGLIATPDAKLSKNRVHLDLRPDNQDAEVDRLERLGATQVDIGQGDRPWVVMADPEGNEFCVLRAMTDEERAAARWGD